MAGNAEEIEQLIKSFEAHYEVAYTSKEYRKTNPKYKYSKDSRVYLELKLKTAKVEK
nr:DUF3970 family protein [Bacillus amyloliquefaciens]